MRVVNASPLIHLARVSLLDLLHVPGQDVAVVVPFIVFQEVLRGARHDPSTSLVEQAARDWLAIVPTLPPHPGIDRGRIDAGEIAVLTVALATPGATVVLEDLAARAEADRLGIPKIGTLHLLLDAKQLGIIPSVLAPIDRLRELGVSSGGVVRRPCERRYEGVITGVCADVQELSDRVVRASSLVENLNSRLRSYFFLRRQLGKDYLTLLQFFLGWKSGVSPSFLPEKMNRHRITRKDEPTPDYSSKRWTDTGLLLFQR
ncbi:MAG: hypothetical protein WBX00_33085 [Isosphaeraceae bacterium]